MPSPKAKVNPRLLTWAREDAGYSVEDAARKVNVRPTRIAAWEAGEDRPSFNQLRNLAGVYKRPVALFFMSDIPEGFQVMRDFRRIPAEQGASITPPVRLELRRAQERRSVALDLASDLDIRPARFRLRCALGDDPEQVGTTIRQALGAGADIGNAHTAGFRAWRTRVEQAGVLVFLIPSVPVAVMRGYSLADPVFPVIGVNRKDALAARSFTLLHEFTHLMLNVSGVCDASEAADRRREDQTVEKFCNAVGAATLIPLDLLRAHEVYVAHAARDPEWNNDELHRLGLSFGVSREAMLRRLLGIRRTTDAFYQQKRAQFTAEQRARDEREAAERAEREMRRNVPVETVSVLGQRFIRLAFDNYFSQRLTLNQLSEVLGVKARHVPNIERRLTE